MSIGPSTVTPQETRFEKIKVVTIKLATRFFEQPARILFYGGSFALLAGLFFGMTFPVEYYIVLGLFGTISLIQWYLSSKTPNA